MKKSIQFFIQDEDGFTRSFNLNDNHLNISSNEINFYLNLNEPISVEFLRNLFNNLKEIL